jgi:hypothetical protein
MLLNKPSVIYEESEEETDERMKSHHHKQIETSKAIGDSSLTLELTLKAMC